MVYGEVAANRAARTRAGEGAAPITMTRDVDDKRNTHV